MDIIETTHLGIVFHVQHQTLFLLDDNGMPSHMIELSDPKEHQVISLANQIAIVGVVMEDFDQPFDLHELVIFYAEGDTRFIPLDQIGHFCKNLHDGFKTNFIM